MVCSSARCAACTCSLQVLMAIVYLGELCWLPSVFPVQATTYDLRPTIPAKTYRTHPHDEHRGRKLCHVISVTRGRALSLVCSLHWSLPCRSAAPPPPPRPPSPPPPPPTPPPPPPPAPPLPP